MTDYKFRAECMHDVQELYNIVEFRDSVTNFIVAKDPIGLPDVDVSFTSTLSADHICDLLATIPDTHVAIESLDLAANYTGDRNRDYMYENELSPVVVPMKIPDSCIIEPGKIWPNQSYIDLWLGNIEHQLKFCDSKADEVIQLKAEVEKVRENSCCSKELFDSHVTSLNSLVKTYLDTLPDDD